MNPKKLSLNKETLRALHAGEAEQAAGGYVIRTLACTLVCPPLNTLKCFVSLACV